MFVGNKVEQTTPQQEATPAKVLTAAAIAAAKALEIENNKKKYAWESEALKVIEAKIAHYKKTGNIKKLNIYLAKRAEKKGILPKIKALIPSL